MPGGASLSSAFAVSDLAQASIASAAGALASLVSSRAGASPPRVTVHRELASAWFLASIRPQGWSLLPVWDAIAGDYATGDGWIRIHTNAPHHRARAIEVLQVSEDRGAVAAAVLKWPGDELETAIVDAGGAAAAMRSVDQWRDHPQGRAVAGEPLVLFEEAETSHQSDGRGRRGRTTADRRQGPRSDQGARRAGGHAAPGRVGRRRPPDRPSRLG